MIESNNRFLQRVNPEILRAKADGGVSNNHPEIQRLMRQMVDLGIADDLKFWMHSGLVKERVSGSDVFAEKVYDISGEENDAVQNIEVNQPESNDKFVFGGNHQLEISNTSLLPNSGDFCCLWWANPIDNNQINGFFGNNNFQPGRVNAVVRFDFFDNPFRVFMDGVQGRPFDSNSSINDGEWKQVGFQRQGNQVIIIIDGVFDVSYSNTTGTLDTSENYIIGSVGPRLDNNYVGSLNDFRVFHSPLTENATQAIYNATKDNYQ